MSSWALRYSPASLLLHLTHSSCTTFSPHLPSLALHFHHTSLLLHHIFTTPHSSCTTFSPHLTPAFAHVTPALPHLIVVLCKACGQQAARDTRAQTGTQGLMLSADLPSLLDFCDASDRKHMHIGMQPAGPCPNGVSSMNHLNCTLQPLI